MVVNSGVSQEAVREIIQETIEDIKKEFQIIYLTQYQLDQTESKFNQKLEAVSRLIEGTKSEINSIKGRFKKNEFEIEEIKNQLERESVADKLEALESQL